MANKKQKLKKIFSVAVTLILVLSTVICFSVVLKSVIGNNPPEIFGYRFFYIISGSMEPKIPVGSVIVVKKQSEYEKGDVITFRSDASAIAGEPNTHRIIDIVLDDGGNVVEYRTQGDANSIPDSAPVHPGDVYGKMVILISKDGVLAQVVTFLTTRAGFFILVMIPILLLAVFAMKDFLRAQKAAMEEKVKKQLEQTMAKKNEETQQDKENRS